MNGFQIVAYVGADLDPSFKQPVGADNIVKSWRARREDAEDEKRRLERKHDDAIVQIQ